MVPYVQGGNSRYHPYSDPQCNTFNVALYCAARVLKSKRGLREGKVVAEREYGKVVTVAITVVRYFWTTCVVVGIICVAEGWVGVKRGKVGARGDGGVMISGSNGKVVGRDPRAEAPVGKRGLIEVVLRRTRRQPVGAQFPERATSGLLDNRGVHLVHTIRAICGVHQFDQIPSQERAP
ncbi:hypothetical protein P691DRAFT_781634 [Macrolepiota fuliginosa MF-IS2]|uniref:Uncharacterized protein n=1 Tax=Macrolepiota fuliginosa MF-IS2 TaxID=1400762 RepID=A0A9P5XET5_9AGAR|nr:hypothetical protein P691DRAFT_781634 [Macrolepiota fuliginosa MF-IS2]